MKRLLVIVIVIVVLAGCRKSPVTSPGPVTIDSVLVNNIYAPNYASLSNIDYSSVKIEVMLNRPVDTAMFDKSRIDLAGASAIPYIYSFSSDSRNLFIIPANSLLPLTLYRFTVNAGTNLGGIFFNTYTSTFRTRIDTTPKFPKISDDSLLTLVQSKAFSYFWDYAHPVSGLARERLGSGETVTMGGSGFGLMAILTGINRNFITRSEGFDRIKTIVNFLSAPTTDRFHGAFPHWMNGSTGKVIPFSQYDDGGDLVETSFLMEGLLTVRAYFKNGSAEEQVVCDSITSLWNGVDWNWYRQGGQNVLYWHWSPDYGFKINLTIQGWNEALIVYVLAASSPVNPIPPGVYTQGWARNGAPPMVNNKVFYNIKLPLGPDYGGPLFFEHYSFMGLDPRNLSDQYASYHEQNVAHTMINRAYCIANPNGFAGYGPDCWGLTASDIQNGYTASSPTNDVGVIAPTAAISSMPYTPDESLSALRFFYFVLGNDLWGEFGFHDAFDLTTGWFATSYLAIDEGPIVNMIENYRSGFLWDLFMSDQDVRNGLSGLGFTY
ncbi:MAG: glucoamylase family protein [Bacteroidales bacterium]